MKKKLGFFLFCIVATTAVSFWLTAAEAKTVGCGSTNGVDPTKISVGDTVECTISGQGTYYYFYLTQRTDVTMDLESPGMKAKFCVYKGRGAYGFPWVGKEPGDKNYSTPTLDAGSWTIMVNPWTTQSSNFTLKVYAQAPAAYCGDRTCDSNETCSSCSSDCGSCGPVCGDDSCGSGENCSNCSADCGCLSFECCKPGSANAGADGCVWKGKETRSGYICCDGSEYQGNCCSGSDCSSYQECKNHRCAEPTFDCGDGFCGGAENCSSCPSDCGCTVGKCCFGHSDDESGVYISDTDYFDDETLCLYPGGKAGRDMNWPESDITYYICCNGHLYSINESKAKIEGEWPDCCADSDCSGSKKCVDHYCAIKEEGCPPGTCDLVTGCETRGRTLKFEDFNCNTYDPGFYRESCEKEQAAIEKKCVEQGERGRLTRKEDNTSCTYICCSGVIKDFGEAMYVPDCCANTDCAAGKECVNNYCKEKEKESGEEIKKSNGEFCNENEECKSGNCRNYRCCVSGKECCSSHYHCGLDEYCSSFYHFCEPAKPLGQKCEDDQECLSNNCGNEVKICCEGGVCCQDHSDCRENEYCEDGTYYCRYKWRIGEACGDYGSAMCYSGYCDFKTRECAEKPLEEEKPVVPEEEKPVIPEEKREESAPAGLDIVLSLPEAASLKKGQKFTPLIAIENKSQKEIVLAEKIEIENPIPSILEISQTPLRIYKTKLLPGEKVTVEAKNRMESIETLTLTGKGQGAGEIKVKAIYFTQGRPITRLEKSIPVEVSWEHIQREEKATAVFGKKMILDEEKEGYIFVEPEDSKDHRANTNYWQEAQTEVKKHLDKLKDDFKGAVEPEIISFFGTIKELEGAKTAEEITETAIRAVAPPIIIGAIDFANLLNALEERKKQEKAFLEHFGATEFQIIGSSKAIIREREGKKYAIKIGDL